MSAQEQCVLWQSLWSCWPCWPVYRLVSIRRHRLFPYNRSAAIAAAAASNSPWEPARQRQGQLDTQPVTAHPSARQPNNLSNSLWFLLCCFHGQTWSVWCCPGAAGPLCDPNNSNTEQQYLRRSTTQSSFQLLQYLFRAPRQRNVATCNMSDWWSLPVLPIWFSW